MTRVEVTRHVAADPASVALLLAEPPSEKALARGVIVSPPRRAGVGFTAAVEVMDASGRPVTGDVTIEPARDAGCDVRLLLTAFDDGTSRAAERAGMAFLAELAARARSRSRAA